MRLCESMNQNEQLLKCRCLIDKKKHYNHFDLIYHVIQDCPRHMRITYPKAEENKSEGAIP